MPIAFRHRDDANPFEPPTGRLIVHRENDPSLMTRLQGRGLHPRLLDAIVDAESRRLLGLPAIHEAVAT